MLNLTCFIYYKYQTKEITAELNDNTKMSQNFRMPFCYNRFCDEFRLDIGKLAKAFRGSIIAYTFFYF